MMKRAELADHGEKEGVPLCVVRGLEVKSDWYVGRDTSHVNGLNRGSGGGRKHQRGLVGEVPRGDTSLTADGGASVDGRAWGVVHGSGNRERWLWGRRVLG